MGRLEEQLASLVFEMDDVQVMLGLQMVLF